MNSLQNAIETLLEKVDIQTLKRASQRLTSHYHDLTGLSSEEEMLAYLAVRLPATYASIHTVLNQLPSSGTILDLGAGPGTVWWAACSTWETPPVVVAVEREAKFIQLGKKLGSQVTWIQADLLAIPHFELHDWVVFGYSLGELPENELTSLLDLAWKAARKGVIVVEPGTPRGYHRMLFAREAFIQAGGSVLAPCPHSQACPLPSNDWCHFSVRLERSFLHRHVKLASLPYEDEKFSYVIVTKEKAADNPSRIIRPPLRRGGHVILPLCTPTGLQNTTISRSQKELYKKAKKADWGDAW